MDACAVCGNDTPEAEVVRGARGDVCRQCAVELFQRVMREQTGRAAAPPPVGARTESVREMVEAHLGSTRPDDIKIAARTYPIYLRVDLCRTLERLLVSPEVRCVGAPHSGQMGITQLMAFDRGAMPLAPEPLQSDDVDVGEDAPVRCLRSAMWFPHEPRPHIVILAPAHGPMMMAGGLQVEVVVPSAGGDAIADTYFRALDEAQQSASSYRGKILSFEQDPRMIGTQGPLTVHRITPVERDEVILPPATLELLERNVFRFAAHRESLRAMGLPLKKGLLFHGPPGTGKTHTIRFLATALPGHTTLLIAAQQVILIGEYMRLARLLSPSIVVVEDVDLIAREREHMGSPLEEVLLNQLLNEMDGLREAAEVIFILTTNRPEKLEIALTARPGRIDQAIEFPFPDADGRRKLARLYGRGAPISAATLEHVVERTDGVSASFIKELMRRAAQFALERDSKVELLDRDIDAALEEMLFAGGRLNAALLGAPGARSRPPGT